MTRGARVRLVVGALMALVATGLVISASVVSAGNSTYERLPDLDQATPYDISVRVAGTSSQPRYLLGFGSAVTNIGNGPLIIDGRRPAGRSTMVASQVIKRRDGSTRRLDKVGTLRFTYSPDHNHWHYLHFDRYQVYELKREDRPLRRLDQKTGFCLGDRYRASRYVPSASGNPTYTSACGLGQPGKRSIREGISPGYGDDYAAHLEGQEVNITGLPSGNYWLVHHANADGKLKERFYSNNAASVRLSISWPNGQRQRPRVQILRRCPNSAECPA